jgi:hypothetical protein
MPWPPLSPLQRSTIHSRSVGQAARMSPVDQPPHCPASVVKAYPSSPMILPPGPALHFAVESEPRATRQETVFAPSRSRLGARNWSRHGPPVRSERHDVRPLLRRVAPRDNGDPSPAGRHRNGRGEGFVRNGPEQTGHVPYATFLRDHPAASMSPCRGPCPRGPLISHSL